MIYDLLGSFKIHLLARLRPATVDTYYKRLCLLFEGQSITGTVRNLDIDLILEKLGQIKHKNYFSQSKSAFLHFCEYQNISLSSEVIGRINALEENTKKKHRKLKPTLYSTVDKKIKYIRNKKLKLSYQAMLATGLRVSELADIAPANCAVTSNGIGFTFTGRGGEEAVASICSTAYPKLCKDLKTIIEKAMHTQEKKLFYSANYLQTKAKPLGFTCHDLRRLFAKMEHKKSRSKAHVMEKMRHKSMKATNRYLRNGKAKV